MSTVALMRGLRREGVASAAICQPVGSADERQAIVDATEGATTFTLLYSWNRKFRAPWHQRPIKELKQGLRTGWARWSAHRVAAEAVRLRADLLHTNTILNPEGAMAARALELPHVWHLRELLGPGAWFRLPLEGQALGRFLGTQCSTLVANSEATAVPVREGLPPERLAIVYNGIDISRFDHPAPAAGSADVVVGMVANLASHFKKHWLFVEAAGRVDRTLPVQFRIYGADPSVGRSPEEQPYVFDLRARIDRLGLNDRISFRGFYPDPVEIMREIDLLVHPSDLESFGRIAVEAMAASRPVVGVRGGGIAEIVEDGVTGLLGAPDEPAIMARHIERLVADRTLRTAMGAAGRRRAEKCFSLDAHVARMLEVYTSSMTRPLGRRRPAAATATVRLAS